MVPEDSVPKVLLMNHGIKMVFFFLFGPNIFNAQKFPQSRSNLFLLEDISTSWQRARERSVLFHK